MNENGFLVLSESTAKRNQQRGKNISTKGLRISEKFPDLRAWLGSGLND